MSCKTKTMTKSDSVYHGCCYLLSLQSKLLLLLLSILVPRRTPRAIHNSPHLLSVSLNSSSRSFVAWPVIFFCSGAQMSSVSPQDVSYISIFISVSLSSLTVAAHWSASTVPRLRFGLVIKLSVSFPCTYCENQPVCSVLYVSAPYS